MAGVRKERNVQRYWFVLSRRYGPGNADTLAIIGKKMSVSRERVRQLEKAGISYLFEKYGHQLDKLETELSTTRQSSAISDQPAFAEASLPIEDESGLTAYQTLVLVRALVSTREANVISRWHLLSQHACALEPPIKTHPEIKKRLEAKNKVWTYIELAQLVLEEAGEPLHWSEIVKRAEEKGLRREIYPTSMFNAIQSADDHFARTGPGTYGLVAWGLEDVPFFLPTIQTVLENHGSTMTLGAIEQNVVKIRPIKRNTLLMYLDLHPEFYKSASREYGLREWLPPIHKQTLRTPKHLIETAASRKRLDRDNPAIKTYLAQESELPPR